MVRINKAIHKDIMNKRVDQSCCFKCRACVCLADLKRLNSRMIVAIVKQVCSRDDVSTKIEQSTRLRSQLY